MRQRTSGAYSLQLSETEFSLIKTALKQAERVTRFEIDVLDEAGQAMDGEHLDRPRLRRDIEALARREASLRSLHEAIAETDRGEESRSCQKITHVLGVLGGCGLSLGRQGERPDLDDLQGGRMLCGPGAPRRASRFGCLRHGAGESLAGDSKRWRTPSVRRALRLTLPNLRSRPT